jgi:hypothetical protein
MRRNNQCYLDVAMYKEYLIICHCSCGGIKEISYNDCSYSEGGSGRCPHLDRDGFCTSREARNEAATKLVKVLRKKYGVEE